MLVEFGAPGFACRVFHLRNLKQNFFGTPTDAVCFFKRRAGQSTEIDGERTFVERRKEGATETKPEDNGQQRQHNGHCPNSFLGEAKHTPKHATIGLLQSHHPARLASLAVGIQQVGTQNGRQRQRNERRGKKTDDETDAQRLEHPSLHAAQEKERNKTDDDDERGVENGHSNLFRSLENHFQPRATRRLRQTRILTKPLENVFYVHNRVIHQRPDGNRHATDGHRVHCQPHEFQYEQGDQQRERDGHERDEGRARIHQKDEKHEHDKDAAFEQ